MQEYNAPQSFDKPARQPEGTLLEHGADVGINVGELSRQENIANALADVKAAQQPTQPLVEAVQKRLEYTPLSQHEVVQLIGRKVVFDLRKGYNETHINLFDNRVPSGEYLYSPDKAGLPVKEQLGERADSLSKGDVELTA